jgi:hypothetical protein
MALLFGAAVGVSAAGPMRPLDTDSLRRLIAALLEESESAQPAAATPAASIAPGVVPLAARAASAQAAGNGPPQSDVPRRPESHPVLGDYRGPKIDPPASPSGPKD